jgi:hypothetical protein
MIAAKGTPIIKPMRPYQIAPKTMMALCMPYKLLSVPLFRPTTIPYNKPIAPDRRDVLIR